MPVAVFGAAQGDRVANVVRVSSAEGPGFVESPPATVTAVIPVAATLQLAQYTPGASGASLEPVVRGAYRTGLLEADPLALQELPRLTGASAGLDLSAPLRLSPAAQLHQGDPLFLRVADLDQNLDRTARETLLVTLTDDRTGDVEVVLLTETGPDTGVFVGYVQTARTAGPAAHDGLLAVESGSRVTARYVDPDDQADATSAGVLVDPHGLVFDSQTGQPVNGASLTVLDVATGAPAEVLGDDGVSTFPSTVTSGGTAQDSSGRVYTFASGGYRFPFLRPGSYRFVVVAPPGYRAPSTAPTASLQALPGAPFAILEPGSRGEAFTLDPGPALRVDVPIDPAAGTLVVQKAAGKVQAAIGDVVPYQVDVANRDGATAVAGVRVVDLVPVGFRYRPGSAQVGGVAAADPGVSADGRTLTFELGTLAPSQSVSLRYVLVVGAGARAGAEAVNVARATGAGGTGSQAARASVRVVDELLSTKAFILGRVTTGACDPRTGVGAEGASSVRVLLEDGTWVMTDRSGLFHFEGLAPGSHVVQLDLDTLPPGTEVVPCTQNDRFAGRASSQFVNVQGGTAWRADFHLAPKPAPAPPAAPPAPPDPAPPAAVTLSMPAIEPVPEPSAPVAAPAPAAPASPPPPAPGAPAPADGLVSPIAGELVADRVVAVQVRLLSALTVRLEVDGKEIPATRVGYKRADPKTGRTDYTFVGVDLGEQGTHALVLTGRDSFGNERHRQEIHVTRVGEIASIRWVEAGDNVADGKTPIRLRFELRDAKGDLVNGATRLSVREGSLQGYRREGDGVGADPDAAGKPYADKDGWALFQPVGTAGPYRAVIAAGAATVEVETWVKPRLRDWILVGLAEGTVAHDAVKGNLESLDAADSSAGELWKDGRVAFYAKGQVQGKWLVTMSLDTARTQPREGAPLFQTIDPTQYFTVYGDAGQQASDAPSAGKLYLRIEREQLYAMFGDFQTGLTTTELSRYSRRMNGLKAEVSNRHLEVNAFAAHTDQVFVRDELPGDGTSGLYRLSRRGLTLGSEVVTLVARDRFHPERVISSRTMVRFVDYSIDVEAGTLFFSAPVPSRDFALNPIAIVVEYELAGSSGKDYTFGGRAGVKLLDQRLRAGVTAIHEGQGARAADLVGADLRLKLGADTQARAELASTDAEEAGAHRAGLAWLGELQHTGRAFDLRLYLRQQDPGFGLGQGPAFEAGTRRLGLEGALRLGEQLGLTAQAYRQEIFTNGAVRTVADARATWRAQGRDAYLGVLDATDTLGDGSRHHSGQLTAGGKLAAGERLTLGLDLAQSAWGDENADFPTRVAGRVEYKLTRAVTLVGVEEVTSGGTGQTQNTRVGLQATPWDGAAAHASLEQQLGESTGRVLGSVGLRQTWQLTPQWKVDAGAERAQTIEREGSYELQPGVPPASGATTEDFTALTAGAAYQRQGFVADGRVELRASTSEDRWVVHSGAVAELSSGWGVSGKAQLVTSRGTGGAQSALGDLRLGLVYRPPAAPLVLLHRLDLVVERRSAGPADPATLSDTESWRLVGNAVVNLRPVKEAQVSLGLGARFTQERIAGEDLGGFSDQLSAEGRFDLSARWDVGGRVSVRHTWATSAAAWSFGPSIGFSPVTNAWVSVGYNVLGYRDPDFSAADYTAAGPFLSVRVKFDQQSIVELGQWINRQ